MIYIAVEKIEHSYEQPEYANLVASFDKQKVEDFVELRRREVEENNRLAEKFYSVYEKIVQQIKKHVPIPRPVKPRHNDFGDDFFRYQQAREQYKVELAEVDKQNLEGAKQRAREFNEAKVKALKLIDSYEHPIDPKWYDGAAIPSYDLRTFSIEEVEEI